jgi:hypothetical protein
MTPRNSCEIRPDHSAEYYPSYLARWLLGKEEVEHLHQYSLGERVAFYGPDFGEILVDKDLIAGEIKTPQRHSHKKFIFTLTNGAEVIIFEDRVLITSGDWKSVRKLRPGKSLKIYKNPESDTEDIHLREVEKTQTPSELSRLKQECEEEKRKAPFYRSEKSSFYQVFNNPKNPEKNENNKKWKKIIEIFQKSGVPVELALIGFIESHLKSNAISQDKDYGTFQINMGLNGAFGYPEVYNAFRKKFSELRKFPDFETMKTAFTAFKAKNPTKQQKKWLRDFEIWTKKAALDLENSTEAAAKYLSVLARIAMDRGVPESQKWNFAVSGYNFGPTKLQKAIARLREEDLPMKPESFGLIKNTNLGGDSELTEENKNYFLRFLAAKTVFEEEKKSPFGAY